MKGSRSEQQARSVYLFNGLRVSQRFYQEELAAGGPGITTC